MNRTIRATLAAAAMSVVLAGCTGSSDEPEAQAEATPQEQWATSLCKEFKPTTAPVEPPTTDDASPAESKEAIMDFLRTLRDRLKAQAQVLTDAGAPPEVDVAAYDNAKKSLAVSADTLQGVIKNLKAADPKDAQEMQATLMQVSESLSKSSSYQGPLAELSASNAGLKQAFEKDGTCKSIMS